MSDAQRHTGNVLSLKGLVRRYKSGDGEIVVLDGVDLDVAAGEIVGLVGPSGSGKSSLLHAAGLLERPSDGEVWIDGEAVWPLGDDARTAIRRWRVGFVYQFHNLLAEFDALDNVALPALVAGRDRKEARGEAERLLGLMGLSERMHHQPAQLSGGEQQRVAIARALVNKPRLILADEPTGNLDVDTSTIVFGALTQLVRQEGASALIATHNLDLTRYMDRVMALEHHKLVQRVR